jgi:hypothetical protein
MKTIHEAELLAADERASQRYIRMTEELRDQLEREKEVAIAREREDHLMNKDVDFIQKLKKKKIDKLN